jgi:hypothetical protein
VVQFGVAVGWWRFGGSCCSHLQGVKMEVAWTSETLFILSHATPHGVTTQETPHWKPQISHKIEVYDWFMTSQLCCALPTISLTLLGYWLWGRRPGRETDHSPPSSAEVKNAWSYTSTSPIRLHGVVLILKKKKHRGDFTTTTQHPMICISPTCPDRLWGPPSLLSNRPVVFNRGYAYPRGYAKTS